MANIFYIGDTHFGHTNSWAKFKNNDGTPLRPFTSNEEMDETMIENWNKVVRPQDHVWHLGDVVINKRSLVNIQRLNGHKRLVPGNHDIEPVQKYLEAGFEKVQGYRVFVDEFICSHMPIHPDCISERFIANVHGHLHGNRVRRETEDYKRWFYSELEYTEPEQYEIDPRYYNVSVEQINFTPIAHEDVKARIKAQMDEQGYVPPAKGWGNGSKPS